MFTMCLNRLLLILPLLTFCAQAESIDGVGRVLLQSARSFSKSSASATSGYSAEKIAARAVCNSFEKVRVGHDIVLQSYEVAKAFGKATSEALATATAVTETTGNAEAKATAIGQGKAIAEIIAKAFAECSVKVCGETTDVNAQAEAVVKVVQKAVAKVEASVESDVGSNANAQLVAIANAVASVTAKSIAKLLVVIKDCEVEAKADVEAQATKAPPTQPPKKKSPKTPYTYYPSPAPYYLYDPSPTPSPIPAPYYPPHKQCPVQKCYGFSQVMCCTQSYVCRMMGYEYVKEDNMYCSHVKMYYRMPCYC